MKKVSSFVTDIILKFDTDREWYLTFHWYWLPSLPSVKACIREIFVHYPSIDQKVPPLLTNLGKLYLGYNYQYGYNDSGIFSRIVFLSSLREFVSNIPRGSISVYANLSSTLQKLDLDGVLEFSVETFNALNLPNLKDLVLTNISDMTKINELFGATLTVEEFRTCGIKNYYFRTTRIASGVAEAIYHPVSFEEVSCGCIFGFPYRVNLIRCGSSII
ncbi:hypothetical protein BABINDRAFT_95650 [Babjeviella inositovora NRRL Y-12698]|uniref:Uncharacterized protein n=1 Tax=Babjeviella inositovora NRRL Y-12698 TaxID=984486 RepID=A0A1E3QJS7_9ASCO|nr:uncharacterized protein BABINDRAFT_95650 [Babjeviella inositovora NRRL Y-12698]ODQ77933.1 hypothetical protein BABINDRAFT_95650 [Babjeviella inositovora NRRL Y-12698]